MIPTFARRLISAAVILALTTAAPGVAQTSGRATGSVNVIYVPSGESTTVAVAGVTRLAIGDSQIAGVVMAGDGQLLVNGKTHGHTTLFVWQGMAKKTYLVEVTQQSLDDYARVHAQCRRRAARQR